MPIREIQRVRASGKTGERIAMLMALNCAPVLKGSKVANLMTVTRAELPDAASLLYGTDIYWRVLDTKGDKVILYLYRKKELQAYLERRDISGFLAQEGYDGAGLIKMLERLALRLWQYDRGMREYPHEMGVFLGYPLKDVTGFMENDGKNYAHLGYWKVYHDVPGALRLFERYDREREQAVDELVRGKSIREIAV